MAFYGCDNFKTGDGGMLYKIIEDKSGETIKVGDFTALTYSVKTEEGTTLYNSYDEDSRPVFKFREPARFKGDFFTALGLLSEGDSAVFKINIDSLVKKTGETKPVTKGAYLIYTIKVNNVVARGQLNDSIYNSKIEQLKMSQAIKAQQTEKAKFNNFLSSKSLKPVITATGLNYIINQKGTGSIPIPGDSVEVNYTAYFLSGKVIETSSAAIAKKANIYNQYKTYGPVKYPVVSGNSLSATQQALLLFPKGTKVTLYIPSRLGYGATSYKNMQPYTPFICEFDIVNIIHPTAGAKINHNEEMHEKEQVN